MSADSLAASSSSFVSARRPSSSQNSCGLHRTYVRRCCGRKPGLLVGRREGGGGCSRPQVHRFASRSPPPLATLPSSAPGVWRRVGRGVWWCSRGFAEQHVSRMPSERLERSPMSRTPSLRLRLLPAFAGAMLLLGATGAAARAGSYGELGHFGAGGTGPGQCWRTRLSL